MSHTSGFPMGKPSAEPLRANASLAVALALGLLCRRQTRKTWPEPNLVVDSETELRSKSTSTVAALTLNAPSSQHSHIEKFASSEPRPLKPYHSSRTEPVLKPTRDPQGESDNWPNLEIRSETRIRWGLPRSGETG